MQVFWEQILHPLIKQLAPQHIIEVGADRGLNTRKLCEYCHCHGATLTAIDPAPSYSARQLKQEFGNSFEAIEKLSIEALPQCSPAELILLDGDHNWYTVYNELLTLEKHACDNFPLVLMHDIGWPYARRDMYYNSDTIPAEFVQPSRVTGLDFSTDAMTDSGGINRHLLQAKDSGTARNGVKTAIEDFCNRDNAPSYTLRCYTGMFGLGVLYRTDNTQLAALIEQLDINARMTNILENDRLRLWQENTEKEEQLNAKLQAKTKNINSLKSDIADLQTALKASELATAQAQRVAHSMRISSRLMKMAPIPAAWRQPAHAALHILKDEGTKPLIKKLASKAKKKISNSAKPHTRRTPNTPAFERPELSSIQIHHTVAQQTIPVLGESDKVSILIVTHNGANHLRNLLPRLVENTNYPNWELIVVDNASVDDSINYLHTFEDKLALTLIKNGQNESFSFANNQAANAATGELLVLMNNDLEPLPGWLEHMLSLHENEQHVGTVGAQLLYPDEPGEPLRNRIQHVGINFQHEQGEEKQENFFRPIHTQRGAPPLLGDLIPPTEHPALTAACLLIKKSLYLKVGGLDEQYVYGYEDVDLGLKVLRRGYRNLLCPQAVLIHHESSTQKKQANEAIKQRRLNNINTFKTRWSDYLHPLYFGEKLLARKPFLTETKLHFCFAVTEAGESAAAGDYFTALGLAKALERRGYTYSFLSRNEGNWYDLPPEADFIVAMIDAYNPGRARHPTGKQVHSIAWVRNWPDRWMRNPWFERFDLTLSSSSKLTQLLRTEGSVTPIHFPIAYDPDLFSPQKSTDEKHFDYIFTGNNWGKARDIQNCLTPDELPYKFGVYGKDWDQVPNFAPYNQGFANYSKMPSIYASTRLVIDDAVAGITKPYGSVNSRVFEATAAGSLVLSNGIIGARELFGHSLPTWDTKEELHSLISSYLNDPKKLERDRARMHQAVTSEHSYDHRASTVVEHLKSFLKTKESFSIKLPIPREDEKTLWGDYYLGLGLKSALERVGHSTELHITPDWEEPAACYADTSLLLRGLTSHNPKHEQFNALWLISHPDKVAIEELDAYDIVFVASIKYADQLASQTKTPVVALLQCTDLEFFHSPEAGETNKPVHEVLFVGNSRKVMRKALAELLPCQYDVAVYGSHWEGLIDSSYVRASHIPNSKLTTYYSHARVLLNDHWEDMRSKGFISNRIFDALASGAFLVTDDVAGLADQFPPKALNTYTDGDELREIVSQRLTEPSNPDEEKQRITLCQNAVKQHTYDARIEKILHEIGGAIAN